jgi:hypothetical protein
VRLTPEPGGACAGRTGKEVKEMRHECTGRILTVAVLFLVAAGMTATLLAGCGERTIVCGGACQDKLRTIDSAVMQYSAAHNGTYPVSVEEMIPDYLREAPECPAAKKPYTLSDTTPPRAVCPHSSPHTY